MPISVRRFGPGLAVFFVTAAIFLASPVRVPTDSRYSALVSAALLRRHSLQLDPWFAGQRELPYQVEAIGGHVYSWYPPGGPVLSAPLVGIFGLLGLSAAGSDGRYDERSDVIIQAVVAALLMALLTVFFLETVRLLLPSTWSWIVALGAALGTQVWSTASRALWGDTFMILILGAVVWLLVLHEEGRGPRRLVGPLLATLLAWGYFCRPPTSIDLVAVTLYLALHQRRLLVPYLATGAVWMLAFVGWSWLRFGTLLPSYYRIHSFSLVSFMGGLVGILVSPSRGQLVFVPATLFVVYLTVRYARSLPHSRLVMPALVAILGHVGLIAAFKTWDGGHCYGPRYLTSLVPWLLLLSMLGLRALREQRGRGWRVELAAGALLLACSVFVQARGACVRETWTWNSHPEDIVRHPDRVWSWRQSQILAGLVAAPLPPSIPFCVVGARVDLASAAAEPYLVSGWSGGEGAFRWTDGGIAELGFRMDAVRPLVLEMELEGFLPPRRAREQRVEIELNGQALQTLRVNQPGTIQVTVALPATALARDNRLRFRLPDAAFAAPFGLGKDPRRLGVAVHWFRLLRAD